MNRRRFLGGLAGTLLPALTHAHAEEIPPVRAITRGPKYHWFGYYDKLEFDPSGRYGLGMEIDFQHRSPKRTDVLKVGMVDLEDSDRWIELGQSHAWNWQQGCMLQWLPGSKTSFPPTLRPTGRPTLSNDAIPGDTPLPKRHASSAP